MYHKKQQKSIDFKKSIGFAEKLMRLSLIRNNVWDGEVSVDASNTAPEEAALKTSYLKLLKERYENKLKDKANRLNFTSLYSKEDAENV